MITSSCRFRIRKAGFPLGISRGQRSQRVLAEMPGPLRARRVPLVLVHRVPPALARPAQEVATPRRRALARTQTSGSRTRSREDQLELTVAALAALRRQTLLQARSRIPRQS